MKRFLNLLALITFCFSTLYNYPVFAQVNNLPQPGTLLPPSNTFAPVTLKGIEFDKNNPFKFTFILDEGNTKLGDEALKEETSKLITYFLAAVTTPGQDMWVNLSPYEQNRVLPDSFAATDLGNDMLEQDYLLKQLAASLTYPETELGKQYWQAVNNPVIASEAKQSQSFSKVWIVPDLTQVYEDGAKAMIAQSTLKVMTEEDYLAQQKNNVGANNHSSVTPDAINRVSTPDNTTNAFRQYILPVIEKEVNTGKNFAQFRQMHSAIILAAWFKNRLKDSIYQQLYINKQKTKGIEAVDQNAKDKIFARYVEAFKQGAYNYVKRERVGANDYSPVKKITKRAYFSGGVLETIAQAPNLTVGQPPQTGMLAVEPITLPGTGNETKGVVTLSDPSDPAIMIAAGAQDQAAEPSAMDKLQALKRARNIRWTSDSSVEKVADILWEYHIPFDRLVKGNGEFSDEAYYYAVIEELFSKHPEINITQRQVENLLSRADISNAGKQLSRPFIAILKSANGKRFSAQIFEKFINISIYINDGSDRIDESNYNYDDRDIRIDVVAQTVLINPQLMGVLWRNIRENYPHYDESIKAMAMVLTETGDLADAQRHIYSLFKIFNRTSDAWKDSSARALLLPIVGRALASMAYDAGRDRDLMDLPDAEQTAIFDAIRKAESSTPRKTMRATRSGSGGDGNPASKYMRIRTQPFAVGAKTTAASGTSDQATESPARDKIQALKRAQLLCKEAESKKGAEYDSNVQAAVEILHQYRISPWEMDPYCAQSRAGLGIVAALFAKYPDSVITEGQAGTLSFDYVHTGPIPQVRDALQAILESRSGKKVSKVIFINLAHSHYSTPDIAAKAALLDPSIIDILWKEITGEIDYFYLNVLVRVLAVSTDMSRAQANIDLLLEAFRRGYNSYPNTNEVRRSLVPVIGKIVASMPERAQRKIMAIIAKDARIAYHKHTQAILDAYDAAKAQKLATRSGSSDGAQRDEQGRFKNHPGKSPQDAARLILKANFWTALFTVREFLDAYRTYGKELEYEDLAANPGSTARSDLEALVEQGVLERIPVYAGGGETYYHIKNLAQLQSFGGFNETQVEQGLKIIVKGDGTRIPMWNNLPLTPDNFTGFGFTIDCLKRKQPVLAR